MKNVEEIIKKINRNIRVGSYPQLPPDESNIIREYFSKRISLPMDGAEIKISNSYSGRIEDILFTLTSLPTKITVNKYFLLRL